MSDDRDAPRFAGRAEMGEDALLTMSVPNAPGLVETGASVAGPTMRWLVSVAFVVTACGGASAGRPAPVSESTGADGPTVAVALRMVEGSAAEDSEAPSTRVLLVKIVPDEGRTTVEIGEFAGACTVGAAEAPVILVATCWWAGEGARVEVVRDGDVLVARRTDGAAPDDRVLARIALPERATLTPILPAGPR